MKRLSRILPILLLVFVNSIDAIAYNGNNVLNEVIRLSKPGLNYTTASKRLSQRFSPPGSIQPATFTISGIPLGAKIEQAFIWISTSGNGAPITVKLTNPKSVSKSYPMNLIGSGADKCWDYPASLSYRANVTASITGDGKGNYNGNYLISGLPTDVVETGNDVDGATLMIIYSDLTVNYIGNLIINDGSVVRAPGTATQLISKINATSNSTFAKAFIGAGDFQLGSNSISMNGGAAFLTTDWDFWNFYERPTTITKGQTTASFTLSGSNDCWNWTLMGIYYQTKELELNGLEVNQTIQDWENNIPLVEKKKTFVRAFIQSNDATTKNLKPKLIGRRNGVDLPLSPLTADNTATFKVPAQAKNDQELINRRKDINQSLNFTLPPDWLTGTVELSFGEGIDCKEVASTPNDCKATVTFNPSKVMELKFYNREWTDENGVKQAISDATFKSHVRVLEQELLSFYPVSKINIRYGIGDIGTYNFGGATPPSSPYRNLFIKNNSQLNLLYYINYLFEPSIYYLGIVHAPIQNNPQGRVISIGGAIATFHDKAIAGTVPHEIGHLLNREHVPYCNAKTSNPQGFPTDNLFNGKPSLGPMNMGLQKRVYGYNSQSRSIIDPETNFDLMSYCRPSWISDFSYKALALAIDSKFSDVAKIMALDNIASLKHQFNSNTDSVLNHRLVRGTINLDSNNVAFDPIVLMPSNVVPPLPPKGNYQLQCLSSTNTVIKTISFEPTPLFREDSTEPNLASFIIPVLWDSLIKRIIITKNDVLIGEKVASTAIPTVQVLYPNGGETLSGTTTTFTWNADDADDDLLTYGLEFSKDGGNTWEILDIDITDKSYVANLSFLGTTSTGLIRVLVSDGFNVAMDESNGTFSTPNGVPEAYIVEPVNGEVFIGEQPITFSGTARDLDDENLDDSLITWHSNLDGLLGNGESIYKPANELTEGEHTIYFKVTDSFGDSTTDSVKIIIQRVVSPVDIYYTKSTGDLHNTSTWGSNPDGSGTNPTDFGSDKTFQLANRSGVYTMTGDWSVNGIISIPSGSQLQINSNTLSLTNRIGTGTLSGSLTSNLIALPSGDSLTLNFTTGNSSLNNLTVDSGAIVVLGSVLDLYGVLTVNGTLNTGAVSSALLTFKSTAGSTARLAPVSGTILQGFVRTEQYIPPRRAWRMMNSPLDGSVSIFDSWQEGRTNVSSDPNPFPGYGTHITGGSIANGFDQNPGATSSVKRYDNATDAWIPLEQTISESPHQATMIFIRGDRGISLGNRFVSPTPTTLRHSGLLNIGNVNSFVFATGFTAVRNPYQSPINFATLTRDNVQNSFYVWDPKLGGANGRGAYVLISYNGSSYDIVPTPVSPESQNIQTGQSFIVRTENTSLPGSIIFKESDKSDTPTMDVFRTTRSKRSISESNIPVFSNPDEGQGLRITLQVINQDGSSGIVDEVFSSYKSTYLDKVDELDGVKMSNMEENLGMIREGQTLMLERRSLPKGNDTILLKLWNTSPKSYVFEFNPTNLSATGIRALLKDKYKGTYMPISLTDVSKFQFTITNDASSARVDRFEVILTRKTNDTLTTLLDNGVITAYPNPINGRILNISFVNKNKGHYKATLINSVGQIVFTKNINHPGGSAVQTLQLNKRLAKGIYHLLIVNNEQVLNISLFNN